MAAFCVLYCVMFTVLVLMATEIKCASNTTAGVDMIFIADTGHKKVLAATLGAYRFRSLVLADIEVWDVTFSEVNQKLYWASKHNGHIYQANADGSGVKQVSSTSHTEPTSLSIDETNQQIYVAYKGEELISSFNLNGTVVRETPVHPALSKPGAIHVDSENGYLYFTQFGRVDRSPLSGGNITNLHYNNDLGEIEAMAVDVEGQRIVISDPGNGLVVSMNLDGSLPKVISSLSSNYKITDLQFYQGDLYVSNVEREQRSILKLRNGVGRPVKAYTDNRDVLSYPRKFHIAHVDL
ncbi:low-density lipoprotein receptor-related protein 4-like [Strongylocentrotus purpuratus]|uniref:Uncharacterized protein n=1 Tax=Strongylocentrotus purpuratus TaxID=7668 RepID=A0A7M7NVQ1_STRPU|nr:low-density lipoprotein receptor-related protein 4-like [Strongylocentrotus purpuratus]